MAVRGTGRAEYQASKRSRERRPNLADIYRHRLPDFEPGEFDFELMLIRGNGLPIRLDKVSESVEWRDEQAVLQGSMTCRRPIADDPRSLPIGRGNRVRCRVRVPGGRWTELWQMRVLTPEVDPAEGVVSFELLDDLDLVRRTERDRNYRAGKRRPRGWRGHVLAREVCRDDGIPVRRLAECKVRVKKLPPRLRRSSSALDIVRFIYRKEREETHRRFVIRWERGGLAVVPFRRNEVLYVFGRQIIEAMLVAEGSARPFTVLRAKGKIGRGKDAETVRVTVAKGDVVRRFGRVVRSRNFGRVDDHAELRHKARRAYAKAIRVKHSAEGVQVPGVPWIRRGDGVELRIPSEGWRGADALVYTTRVVHRVDSSGYVTEMDVTREDPFVKDRERREREIRAEKRRQRRRRS